MNRTLSQQEIDALFVSAAGGQAQESPSRKVVPFDFRRPDRIAKSQLRAIHQLHETFVHNLVSSLSAYLRTYLLVNLVSVEQLSCEEFLNGLPSPTCMLSLGLRPYDGYGLLELSPALVFPILEVLLGGDGKSAAALRREITEIEQKLLDSLFRIILNDLKEAWQAVAPIEFAIHTVETEPQFLRVLAPSEAVVAVGIEIRIGDNVGMMNIAVPSIIAKMMRQKFDQQWSLRRTQSNRRGTDGHAVPNPAIASGSRRAPARSESAGAGLVAPRRRRCTGLRLSREPAAGRSPQRQTAVRRADRRDRPQARLPGGSRADLARHGR